MQEIQNMMKFDGYQRDLASIVYKYFDEKSTGRGIKNEIKQNQRQLVKELRKLIIRKLKKEKFIHQLKTMFGVLI